MICFVYLCVSFSITVNWCECIVNVVLECGWGIVNVVECGWGNVNVNVSGVTLRSRECPALHSLARSWYCTQIPTAPQIFTLWVQKHTVLITHWTDLHIYTMSKGWNVMTLSWELSFSCFVFFCISVLCISVSNVRAMFLSATNRTH